MKAATDNADDLTITRSRVLNRSRQELTQAVTGALGALVAVEAPEAMVHNDLNHRLMTR